MSKKIVLALSLFTVLAGILYWISVFLGIFRVDELVPGYRAWFMSFPLADSWMFFCALLTVVFVWKQHALTALFAALTGASLIFLGLYAFTYGATTGLLFHLTADEIIEIAIKIYCLTAGPLIIYHGWKFKHVSVPVSVMQSGPARNF